MCACICVLVCVLVYFCVCTCTWFVYLYVYLCVCVCLCVHVCILVLVCTYVCFICVLVCMLVCLCVLVCSCMCTCACVCLCVCWGAWVHTCFMGPAEIRGQPSQTGLSWCCTLFESLHCCASQACCLPACGYSPLSPSHLATEMLWITDSELQGTVLYLSYGDPNSGHQAWLLPTESPHP